MAFIWTYCTGHPWDIRGTYAAQRTWTFSSTSVVSWDVAIVKLPEKQKLISFRGPDDISLKIIYNIMAISCKLLCLLFSQLLSQGLLPSDWKPGKTVPVLKNGDHASASDYIVLHHYFALLLNFSGTSFPCVL